MLSKYIILCFHKILLYSKWKKGWTQQYLYWQVNSSTAVIRIQSSVLLTKVIGFSSPISQMLRRAGRWAEDVCCVWVKRRGSKLFFSIDEVSGESPQNQCQDLKVCQSKRNYGRTMGLTEQKHSAKGIAGKNCQEWPISHNISIFKSYLFISCYVWFRSF